MPDNGSNKGKNVKKRNWIFVVYPTKEQLDKLSSSYDGSNGYGTLPDDWLEQLQKTGLQCAISPLHDKDIEPTGEVKKPHYHVIATYSGPTSFNVVKGLTDSFNAPVPQALEQVRGYYRYLTHKDNPDKYQYDEKEIKPINGFNISDFIELSKSEVNEIKRKLQAVIRQEGIIEYADLMDYLLDTDSFLEYDVASSHTFFFDRYVSSRRHKFEKGKQLKVNPETGELLE